MSAFAGKGPVREVTMEATVLGPCRWCGTGAEFWDSTGCSGPTHDPTFRRPLGVISRWHRSRLVRAWWRVEGAFRRGA